MPVTLKGSGDAKKNRQKANAILKAWKDSGKSRMSSVVRYQLLEQGYGYCNAHQELHEAEEFYKANNDVGIMSTCKAAVSSSSASQARDMEMYLPEQEIKDAEEAAEFFNQQISDVLDKEGLQRVPRALLDAVEQYGSMVQYCQVCRYVHVPRKKQTRKKAKK